MFNSATIAIADVLGLERQTIVFLGKPRDGGSHSLLFLAVNLTGCQKDGTALT
jgi:hypothetical protein